MKSPSKYRDPSGQVKVPLSRRSLLCHESRGIRERSTMLPSSRYWGSVLEFSFQARSSQFIASFGNERAEAVPALSPPIPTSLSF
jgi:hypothetical protein